VIGINTAKAEKKTQMRNIESLSFRKHHPALVLGALFCLTACDGDDGAPGPPGPPAGVDIANAAEINAFIDNVSIASPPVVDFSLVDGNGNPVKNLPADAISFKIAKLVPGTDGNASAWQSYINQVEEPGVGPGTEAKVQATTENGAAGTLIANNDGTYTYTFALDVANVTEPIAVEYVPALTHRVSFEIRGFVPVRNPVFDYRPSDSATSGLFTREIANIANCNACHENLALHGGARFELQDCVTCHNPGSADANSGNTVDMSVMTHKIHRGENLPSVIGGTDYCIYGFRDTPHCYGDVVFPQDIRNCTNCHDDADPATPDASNWYTMPMSEACGACHDDVNFATGENHGPGIPADNAECATCHASNPDSAIEVRQAHRMLAVERTANYQFNILGIDFMGPGTAPAVTFSVTDSLNSDTPYDLANDALLTASPLRFYVAWDTVDYSNAGNGTDNAQPERTNVYDGGNLQATDNGNLTYHLTLTTVAAGATRSGIVTFEGRVDTEDGRVPVTTAFRYFGITDDPMSPAPRRAAVDMARCNDCHELTSQHGSARNDRIEACQVCHIADAARGGDPSAGPMDIKHFIHRKHAVDDIRYPQRPSNCIACHTDDGFYPVASDSGVLATSMNRGADPADPTDNNRVTPNGAVCGVCHASADAQVHMKQNGASFDACQEADGTVRERVNVCGPGGDKTGVLAVESCGVCHGPGRSADVARAHSLDF
jgi:OmcA/MtrC family decaheme c-type cytochrome